MKRTCIILLLAVVSLTGCFEYFNELLTEVDRQWIFHLADTGQSQCYDAGGAVIPCSDGGNYPRQDGLWIDKPSARSFTGPDRHSTYTGDYTTRDNVTGLVWKTCTEGFDGADCSNDNADGNLYSWSDAITRCTALNSLNSGAGYAGRTN